MFTAPVRPDNLQSAAHSHKSQYNHQRPENLSRIKGFDAKLNSFSRAGSGSVSGKRLNQALNYLRVPFYQPGMAQWHSSFRRMHNAQAMRRPFHVAIMTAMWFLAFVAAVISARYLLVPPRFLLPFEILALSRHHVLILLHIACGIVAITVGPFQFVSSLRDTYPRMHHAMGYLYLSAVLVGGCAGLWLSPDTPVFAAHGLTDLTAIDLSRMGLGPSLLGYSASSRYSSDQFFLVMVGFETLALVWLLTAALAFARARQRRFDEHRAWMMRSYSLTFAAATVRLSGLPMLVLTRDPVVAITCTFWSWLLNLVFAEWLIRRRSPVGVPNRLTQTAS